MVSFMGRVELGRLGLALVVVATVASLATDAQAKFLRGPTRGFGGSGYEDYLDMSSSSIYGAGMYSPMGLSTGDRALVTVRGSRNPYDGSAPNRLTLDDTSAAYGSLGYGRMPPYPRLGLYERNDIYRQRFRSPYYPQNDYAGYNKQASEKKLATAASRRRDFFEPDFGLNAALNLASKRRSKCKVAANADSEIPELGLDSGRLNIDCDINPARVGDAAMRAARQYAKYRREKRRHQPDRSSSRLKAKRTRINIEREYDRTTTRNSPSKGRGSSDELEADQDDQDDQDE